MSIPRIRNVRSNQCWQMTDLQMLHQNFNGHFSAVLPRRDGSLRDGISDDSSRLQWPRYSEQNKGTTKVTTVEDLGRGKPAMSIQTSRPSPPQEPCKVNRMQGFFEGRYGRCRYYGFGKKIPYIN